jgi:hypothetical protein
VGAVGVGAVVGAVDECEALVQQVGDRPSAFELDTAWRKGGGSGGMRHGIPAVLRDQEGGTPLSAWIFYALLLPHPGRFLVRACWMGTS